MSNFGCRNGWPVRILVVLASVVMVLGLAGCEERAARELPFPTIDPRAAFPELNVQGDKNKSGSATKSEFERSISQALDGASPAEQPAAVMLQAISLGSGLVGDIPVKFDEWRWGSDGKITMITHGITGQAPDVLIFIEPFTDQIASSPSREMSRFQQDVGLYSMFGRAMAFMDIANSATMGQGIGYQPAVGSFSGWRWVGKTDGDITLRLARSSGVWGAQPGVPPELIGMLEQFAGGSPEVAKLQEFLMGAQARAANRAASNRMGYRAATMILGNAASSATSGIHLAVVCQNSTCGQAAELAHFLGSIRVAGQDSGFNAAEISPPTDSLADLSEYAGIEMIPEELRISPARLMGGRRP